MMFLLLIGSTTFAVVPERVGWWKFDDPMNMLAATTGEALVLTGTQTSVNGPVEGNLATELGLGSHLIMTHGIAANGGGSMVNEYSLQLDILMPTASMWHAIYQTAADNANDAELFINVDNLIGAWRYGYSENAVAENTWYRMVVSVKNGEFFKIYMNGELWVDGAGQEIDSRDALEAALLLFADEDGEDNTMVCSEAGIWNVALTAEEALELGDATTSPTAGFPVKKGHWMFDDPLDMLKAEVGNPLTLTGTQESVAGPKDGNLATQIGLGSYLTMVHGLAANGGGTKVNEYSFQFDFSMPEGGIWHSFFQLTPDNSDDADLFINTSNAIGVWEAGYTTNTVFADIWYRMIVSVKNGEFFRIYVNGELWLDAAGRELDGRYGLLESLLIFGDNDGDDGLIKCSELAIWNVALTAEEAALLGDATTYTGIHQHEQNKSAQLGQNYPNPTSGITVFPYQLIENGVVTFEISDLTGRILQHESLGFRPVGSYNYQVDAAQLPAGIYSVSLMVNQSRIVKRMMVAH